MMTTAEKTSTRGVWASRFVGSDARSTCASAGTSHVTAWSMVRGTRTLLSLIRHLRSARLPPHPLRSARDGVPLSTPPCMLSNTSSHSPSVGFRGDATDEPLKESSECVRPGIARCLALPSQILQVLVCGEYEETLTGTHATVRVYGT